MILYSSSSGDKIEDEIGGACGTYGGQAKLMQDLDTKNVDYLT